MSALDSLVAERERRTPGFTRTVEEELARIRAISERHEEARRRRSDAPTRR